MAQFCGVFRLSATRSLEKRVLLKHKKKNEENFGRQKASLHHNLLKGVYSPLIKHNSEFCQRKKNVQTC